MNKVENYIKAYLVAIAFLVGGNLIFCDFYGWCFIDDYRHEHGE